MRSGVALVYLGRCIFFTVEGGKKSRVGSWSAILLSCDEAGVLLTEMAGPKLDDSAVGRADVN